VDRHAPVATGPYGTALERRDLSLRYRHVECVQCDRHKSIEPDKVRKFCRAVLAEGHDRRHVGEFRQHAAVHQGAREIISNRLVLRQIDGALSGVVPGGSFEGERLSGEVLDGGSDWQSVRNDGATTLNVRLVLKTRDDALIGMTYQGVRHGPPDVVERIEKGGGRSDKLLFPDQSPI
jgi:hypothetical protein